MERPHDIMVAGCLCLDVIPCFPETGATRISDLMRPGKLVNIEKAKISTGGAVSNTGLNMKRLGMDVSFCARLGDDVFGRITTDLLRGHGELAGMHAVEGAASSYSVVIAPPSIDRIFLHHPGTNDSFGPEDLDPELIAQCKHFHFGYPPIMRRFFEDDGETLTRLFQIAKEAGATTSCDMTLPDPASASGQAPWRRILEKVLPYVDIFLPSVEEVFYMLEPKGFLARKAQHADDVLIDHIHPDEYSGFARTLLDMGAKMTTLKSGHRGMYLRTASAEAFNGFGAAEPGDRMNWAGRELWIPALKPKPSPSATGSGDSAIAGFLTAFLRGESVERALRYAVCLGWANLSQLDAVSGIPSWEETVALADSDLPLVDANVDGAGWRWSAADKLFHGPCGEA
jgi:sugar/nucleoside kinase (ribokinase family)